MKILKILGIAAGIHALALILIFANPGCSESKAAGPESSPITSAPSAEASQAPAATVSVPDSVGIRYSPTRPGTTVASALSSQPVSDVTPATTYTVGKGDTLFSIAKKNGLTKGDLASANHLKSSASLHVGQKLIIPAKAGSGTAAEPAQSEAPAPVAKAAEQSPAEKGPMTEATKHTVKPGETLGAIARKYGVKQGEIAVANNITDPKKIQPGQELIIPARSAASGKGAKGVKSAPGDASAAPSRASAAPAADQDLDAGLKPPSATDVPVVKIEEPSTSGTPKKP